MPPTDPETRAEPPTQPDGRHLPPGRRVGKYVLRGYLGAGGMGVVYDAIDPRLQRRVALKTLTEARSADPAALKRFLREGRAAARLNHPHVLTVHEIDHDGDLHYIVMEFMPGGSAEGRLNGGTDWRAATRIAADACRGLAAAHAAGLIHRDVKPSNLLFTAEGVVKLADFGLAKLSESSATTLTRSGQVMGTPHYMSPEQCRAEPLDARSDVYALGATYYALLTGAPPYQADSHFALQLAHCSSPVPDPRRVNPAVPDACAAVVRRAMAKAPSDRFASAADMLAALEAALDSDGSSARPVRPAARPRLAAPPPRAAAAAALLLLAILIVSVALAVRNRPGGDGSQAQGTSPASTNSRPVALVLASSNFWYADYHPLRTALDQAGVRTRVVSSRWGQAIPDPRAGVGGPVPIDDRIADVDAGQFHAVVFCGGQGTLEYCKPEPAAVHARRLIDDALRQGKLVAGLGTGPVVLADAGALRNRRATGYTRPDLDVRKRLVQDYQVNFVDEPYVVSDQILTGRNPEDVPAFARKLLERIGVQPAP